jgi:hypothetical protein
MAQFDIENNFIIGNGSTQSVTGGIALDKIGSSGIGMRILSFNTISANMSNVSVNVAPGVSCSNTVTQEVPFSNNIIFGNGAAGAPQVSGANCAFTYSDIGPVAFSGQGNLAVDPLFVNASGGDFHLTAGSPVIDQADPSATPNVDIDGDHRPQGNRRDIGADEYKSP